MRVDEDPAGPDEVARLGVVQPDVADVALQPLLAESEHLRGGVGYLEELLGGLVDAHVRRLGREDHRDEELERRAVAELALRRRVLRLQAAEDLLALRPVHGAGLTRSRR